MGGLQKTIAGVWMIAAAPCYLAAQTTSPPQAATPQEQKTVLKKLAIGDIHPLHVWGNIYLAGQPTPDDLTRLKKLGIKTIINLRRTQELSWDEAALVKRLGMRYVHAPFQAPQELKPEVFDKVRQVLRDRRQRPVMLHCASSNRVGAIWYAYRVLDGQLLPNQAIKEAQIVGLRTPEYLLKAQAYVESVLQAKEEAKTTPQ